MAQSREDIFNDLKDGQLIGPDHHKFQLSGTSVECPLGQLWQAEDVSTKNPINVSLIMLDPFFLQSKSFLAKFKKQIVRSKTINHSHVADIYGYFIHKGGLLFFAFEPVDGLTLGELISNDANKNLNIKQIQGLSTQLTAAINSCTRQWHQALGALDSHFVFVNKKGGVKLLPISMRDFFLENQGMPDSVYDYKRYCAPAALTEDKLDATADSYTVACATYRLLGGDEFSIQHTQEQRDEVAYSRPASISDEQWDCLQQALSGESSRRYSSAAEFIKAFFPTLSEAQDDSGTSAADVEEIDIPVPEKAQLPSTAINFKLGNKSINFSVPTFTIPLFIFVVGIGLGFILGIFSSSGKIDSANATGAQWQQQAEAYQQQLTEQAKQLEESQARANNLDIKLNSLQQQVGQSSQPGPKPLSMFRDELDEGQYGPDMVVIAAGEFIMGDAKGTGDDNEKPAHKVVFKQNFAISRYEITFAQYDFFVQQTGRKQPDDEGWGRDQQPVINVSWRDARAYTQWLAKETKLPYRLPTEAEWEYSARAGTTTNYWWGDESLAGYAQCSDCGGPLAGKQPLSVGSLKPNPWGLYDFNGNVDEWVIDCYRENYVGARQDGRPYTTSSCQNRAIRGGSWFDINRITRSSSRYRHPPDSKRNTWGFRIALDLTP